MSGCLPNQILFGFLPRYDLIPSDVEVELRAEAVSLSLSDPAQDTEVAFDQVERVSTVQDLRQSYEDRRLIEQHNVATRKDPLWKAPVQGDLVLIRRSVIDGQRGRKLEPLQDGPFIVTKLSHYGRSAYIEHIETGKEMGRHHIDNLKIYIPRDRHEAGGADWRTLRSNAERAKHIWRDMEVG